MEALLSSVNVADIFSRQPYLFIIQIFPVRASCLFISDDFFMISLIFLSSSFPHDREGLAGQQPKAAVHPRGVVASQR